LKIHILFKYSNLPSGGGNQFLKALRHYFLDKNIYSDQADSADLILFNSHHLFDELILLKKKYPNKIFVQRIDGPMILYRAVKHDNRDSLVALANMFIADATIFQSSWSKQMNYKCGIVVQTNFERIIINAPSQLIFNNLNSKNIISTDKIKIIATSWSTNINKGFDDYKWLDENLDFKKYEFIFIGNSPVKFINIIHLQPMESEKLAIYLKESHIFITASRYEACSNALLEALHCGKPAIAYSGSSNAEIIGNAGLVYSSVDEIPMLLELLIEKYSFYKNNIKVPSINEIGDDYLMFFNKIILSKEYSEFIPKKLGLFYFIRLYLCYVKSKIYNYAFKN